MKPHSETLITHFVFPQLCFTPEDENLWLDDPVEYVHARIDMLEDFTSPSTAAVNFMTVMARYRQNAFMQILALANTVLQKYNDAPAEAKNPREKDGALVMVGSLAPLILRKVAGHLCLLLNATLREMVDAEQINITLLNDVYVFCDGRNPCLA